jgi:uncharacterized protein (TIGR00251 family)
MHDGELMSDDSRKRTRRPKTNDPRPTTPNQSPISPLTVAGIHLRLRVQPRASRTELAGIHGDALRVRLSAPPADGAANQALIRLLADKLSVPRSAVRVIAVAVSGIGPEQAARRLGLNGSCSEPQPD